MDFSKERLYVAAMTDENNSIGHRIRQARTASGLTQQALADKLNISVQSVSQWETGRTTPSMDRVMLLTDILGVPWLWLRRGDGGDIADATQKHEGHEAYRNRLARWVDWDDRLGRFGQMGIEGAPSEIEDDSVLAQNEGERDLFCVRVKDGSNSPQFEAGDVIIGDTGVKAEPGDMVFAKLMHKDDVYFRQLKALRHDEYGDLIADLKPLNPDYPTDTINMTSDFDRIIGVMVEHRRFRRR